MGRAEWKEATHTCIGAMIILIITVCAFYFSCEHLSGGATGGGTGATYDACMKG